ncbi:hypothetical protein [Sinimarinibacterium sp. NLF-5-8]|uniref:hypothetical protein n=1 Tax=Sinimarinibacterium sp. NLF-5-8 TaxID=2698684 RepID=UPI00137B9C4E|nr:hypothetical protein [Sinimarinibacterium sp. NLF-5-8]QHS11016.1 hypothetical protein GT972_13255 [Sinimarinibacterium sp. NLF-5-8]
MRHFIATSITAATLALGIGSALPAAAADAPATVSVTVQQTQDALRDLWVGHIFWVRNVVTATLAGNTAEAKAAEDAAVANARSIADAVVPFYGKDAGDALFKLLAGHYTAIKEYLVAKNPAGEKAAFDKLVANANQIAKFLHGANPKNWPEDVLVSLLMGHGGHHVQQIKQLRAKDYKGEAETWEAMKNHMYTIADALAGGLAAQFPDKF